MAQDAAFFAQLSHDANQVAAELIDTDDKLKEASDLKMRLAVWINKAEGNQEIAQSEIEGAKLEHLEYQRSVDASLDRFDALWQQLPRLEQSASSIDGYRIDQFPVMASIRNEAGRNQSHPISHLALELNRIADMAHREAERLWGPADSVKQLTFAATHCRNMARNFLPNLKRKVEFIEDIAAEPERYKRPDEALQEARNASEWVQHYSDVVLYGAIGDFNKALNCKPDPLKCIQEATLYWHGRDLKVEEQPHQTACEAARFWCETIRRKVYDLSIRELHKKRDYLKFLKLLVEALDGLAVADMSAEIDREEQATLKALEPKEPAQNDQTSTIVAAAVIAEVKPLIAEITKKAKGGTKAPGGIAEPVKTKEQLEGILSLRYEKQGFLPSLRALAKEYRCSNGLVKKCPTWDRWMEAKEAGKEKRAKVTAMGDFVSDASDERAATPDEIVEAKEEVEAMLSSDPVELALLMAQQSKEMKQDPSPLSAPSRRRTKRY